MGKGMLGKMSGLKCKGVMGGECLGLRCDG